MGIYLNPGNYGFREILNSNYVDKTGLIDFVNQSIGTTRKLICVSRPRRFGKTLAAKMLSAYYDKSCDSHSLFEGLEISKKSYETHLNKYNVIYLDITWFISCAESPESIVSTIQLSVIQELREAFPDCIAEEVKFLPAALAAVFQKTQERFFFIIDEWDALFRETKDNLSVQHAYIQLLRGLFKGGPTTDKTIVGAYMTGILPIKKYGTESALTDFKEYTMVKPLQLAQYVGFTEEEVHVLCRQHNIDFEKMEQWYDGYSFQKVKHVYSPNSVMSAVFNEEFGNYWTKTETYESLRKYISMNLNGLKDAIITMLGGQRIEINTLGFQNDMTSMNTRDEVLTLLVHLGYLAYSTENNHNSDKGWVYIPNLEVADAFKLAVEDTAWCEIRDALDQSSRLLQETIAGNAHYVSKALTSIHQSSSSILQYNDENSLACALTIAYYTAQCDYAIIREFPTGKGFADLAFIPRQHSDKPAMIVELKYDNSADTAIRQIKEKRYGGELKDYSHNMLLIGISYDKNTKQHECVIEKSNIL